MTERCLRCGRVPDDLIHDHPNDHGWTGTDGMHPFVGEGEKQLLQRVAGELGWHHKTGSGKSRRPLTDDQKHWNAALDRVQAVIKSMFTPIDPAVLAANDKYFADKRQARSVSEAAPEAQPNFTLTMEKRALPPRSDQPRHPRVPPASSVQLLRFVLVPLFPAHVGFVNLDDALQLRQVFSARLPETVQDEPGGLLRDANLFGELKAADALAGRDEQIHGVQPLVERDVRPLENRPGANGEVFGALVTAVVPALADGDPLTEPADRTAGTVRPQPPLQILAGRFLIREQVEQLEGGDSAFGHKELWTK